MIPKDLHVLYGRKEIVYSLKTKDARDGAVGEDHPGSAETHQAIMCRDEGEVVPTPPASRPVSIQTSCGVPDLGNGLSFAVCFEIWKAAVTDRPTKTIADFRPVMEDFVAWAGNRAVSQYTSEDAYGYADHVKKRDCLEPETVDKKLTYLRAIYSAAKKRHKTLPENPFSRIEAPRQVRYSQRRCVNSTHSACRR